MKLLKLNTIIIDERLDSASNEKIIVNNNDKNNRLSNRTERMRESHSARLKGIMKRDINRFLPYVRLKEFLSKVSVADKNSEKALDYLVYGIEAKKALLRGKKIDIVIMQSLTFEKEIVLVHKNKNITEKIDLNLLTDISFGNKRGNFIKNKIGCSKRKTDYKNSNCISLFKSKGESLDLFFNNQIVLNNFSFALFNLLENIFAEDEEYENILNKPIKKLWNLYDNDRSNKLELPEFSKMIRQMNVDFSKFSLNIKSENSIQQIFQKIDKDNSGKIDYDEFIAFYNTVNSGAEFSQVFKKFSHGKEYITLSEFQEFLIKYQKLEDIKREEVKEIMQNYKFNPIDSMRFFPQKEIKY